MLSCRPTATVARSAQRLTRWTRLRAACQSSSPSLSTPQACCEAVFLAPTEQHLQHIAALLAQQRHAGDCYCLHGSVGAGKSVFSRAFIRAAADDPQLPVPSPTYLLQLIYSEQDGPPIHHFDLYRLDGPPDLYRLGLAESFSQAVSLVEWAERLPQQLLPPARLDVHIEVLQGPPAAGGSSSLEQQQQETALLPVLPHAPPGLSSCGSTCGSEGGSSAGDVLEACAGVGEAEVDEDDDDDPFTDQRWRRVLLRGVGEGWVRRLRELAAQQQQRV